MATIPKLLASCAKLKHNLKTIYIEDDGHETCIVRRDTNYGWIITLLADSRSDLVYVYHRHEDTETSVSTETVRDSWSLDHIMEIICEHSHFLFGELVTKVPCREPGDIATMIGEYFQLPWERSIYGISTVGFIFEGHSLICRDCAIEEYFGNPGSIELCDATHSGRMECQSNNPCGNWVGGACSTEGCYEPCENDVGLCDHCQNHLMEYPLEILLSEVQPDPSKVLDLMQSFLTSYLSSNEVDSDTIDTLLNDCTVFDCSDQIRWPQDIQDFVSDSFAEDWNEYWSQTA